MFDYASNNSSIYTKHFLNYNSALVEEEKKKKSNPFEVEGEEKEKLIWKFSFQSRGKIFVP